MKIRGDYELTGFGEAIAKLRALAKPDVNELERLAIDIGEKAVAFAKENCPKQTGELQNSITFRMMMVENDIIITVYTNKEYAIYVEFGTGTKGDPSVEHVQKDRWVYYDEEQQRFITAYARPPEPFMYDAFVEMKEVLPQMIKDYVTARLAELGQDTTPTGGDAE